jgi:hypothetical protein
MVRRRVRFVHAGGVLSVILKTVPIPGPTPLLVPLSLFELRQVHRLAARLAEAAVKRVLYDKCAKRCVFAAAEDVDDERMALRVLAAGPAAAEAARPKRGALTDPAIHPSCSPNRRAQPGAADIVRRPGAKFA